MDELNTIFILSKGRPWCYTAQCLDEIGYPGDWYIWCGDNDETLPKYKEIWGNDKVLVFDHKRWFDGADTMDAFGDSLGSGVFVAKNALRSTAESFGLKRYWELDDDIEDFYNVCDDDKGTLVKIENGMMLQTIMSNVSKYGDDCGFACIGINYVMSRVKSLRDAFQVKVPLTFGSYQVSNVSVDKCPEWRGRLYEDHAFNSECFRTGKISMSTALFAAKAADGSNYYLGEMKNSHKNKKVQQGGLNDVYESMGSIAANEIRRFCTALMSLPISTGKLVFDESGCSFKTYYAKSRAKIISSKWAREEPEGKVLFASDRELGRAENILSLWKRCRYPKQFVCIRYGFGKAKVANAENDGYSAVVTDEFIPPIVGKDKLKVIMVGHGANGMKKYGLDQDNPWFGEESSEQLDYLVTSSDEIIDIECSSSGANPSKCVPLGIPRTDSYFDGSLEKLDFGVDKVYLYVPTFRGRGEPSIPCPDWAALDETLADDELLVVKRHMKTSRKLVDGNYKHIVEVSNNKRSAEYIASCNVLLTDYSSIMLDGYLMGKPCVLYCPDKKEYIGSRGMYFDYPSFYSSRSCVEESHLVELLREAARNGMGEVERNCMEKIVGACDGKSIERILDLLENAIGVQQ